MEGVAASRLERNTLSGPGSIPGHMDKTNTEAHSPSAKYIPIALQLLFGPIVP